MGGTLQCVALVAMLQSVFEREWCHRNLLEAMTLRVQNAWHTASEIVCHSVVNMLVSIAALAERSKRMTQVSTSTE